MSLGVLAEHLEPIVLQTTSTSVTALLPYRHTSIRALILEAKFHESKKAFALLGTVLADYLLAECEEHGFENRSYVLIPIPLSKRRFRERGYNQVERIVREALTMLPGSFSLSTTLLKRVRDTSPQTKLGRNARLKNMMGAFECAALLDHCATYILVDDVATTGATLQAGHTALVSKGAQEVQMLTLAH
jgi:ComF family protein